MSTTFGSFGHCTSQFEATADLVAVFDAFRKKRNLTGPNEWGTVSDADPAEMRQLAVRNKDDVSDGFDETTGRLSASSAESVGR